MLGFQSSNYSCKNNDIYQNIGILVFSCRYSVFLGMTNAGIGISKYRVIGVCIDIPTQHLSDDDLGLF